MTRSFFALLWLCLGVVGESGAMDALIALKLSRHPQFADKAGGCALAERAAKAGDIAAARHLGECRK